MPAAIRNLLIFIATLGGLILIHELGHLIAALLGKVKVKEIGLGLPPRICRITSIRNTDVTLNWIPLGGFVRLKGEFDASTPDSLLSQPARTRLAIFLAGPLCNMVIGYLLLTLTFIIGFPDRVRITSVSNPSPAYSAGLRPGDIIVKANDAPITENTRLGDVVNASLGQPVIMDILRGEKTITTIITPRMTWPEGQGPAGFTSTMEIVRYPLFGAMQRAGEKMLFQIREFALLPVRLLQGRVEPEQVRFASPLGLKQMSDQVVENALVWDAPFPLLNWTAVLSIALGLTNLLPLPALDGGRILFVLIEAIRGKAIDIKLEKIVHAAGMVALFGLMFVLLIHDIVEPLF
jgi:regulator of sigma E protease